jgi:hypothetical protein
MTFTPSYFDALDFSEIISHLKIDLLKNGFVKVSLKVAQVRIFQTVWR